MKQTGNTILVTGGTSGIGRELAERFHALGNKVIVAGRRREKLDEIVAANEGIVGYVLDVESRDGIAAFAAKVVAENLDLNVLVNNAGIMVYEDASSPRDLADAEAMVTTNILGPIRLIDALVGHLAGKADASIVNVSSGLAFLPMTAAPTYSATKAAIHSYTVSLREALRGRVEVIELVPPAVQTDLTPGQATNPDFLSLADFMAEVMALLAIQPTPPEILVDRVRFLRFAEAEAQFEQRLAMLNGNSE